MQIEVFELLNCSFNSTQFIHVFGLNICRIDGENPICNFHANIRIWFGVCFFYSFISFHFRQCGYNLILLTQISAVVCVRFGFVAKAF